MNKIEVMYREIQPRIYAFFYVKTSNRAVAEDLTQDVFYEACKGINSFAENSTLQTWLFAIARNLLKKYYRSKKYKRSLDSLLTSEVGENTKSPEDIFIINEATQRLIKQIQSLDDLPKEIVALRIYGELSFKEIGQLVEKSENYVRVTFHRTKLKLQRETEEK